eukprot:scaffold125246_cov69-Phaeocystis_antarctica.AAC.1
MASSSVGGRTKGLFAQLCPTSEPSPNIGRSRGSEADARSPLAGKPLTAPPRRSSFSSSLSSSTPEPSGSHSVKRSSISEAGTLNCSSAIALWNSSRDTLPLLSPSQSLNKSTTRTAAFDSASRSCSATVLPDASSMSARLMTSGRSLTPGRSLTSPARLMTRSRTAKAKQPCARRAPNNL